MYSKDNYKQIELKHDDIYDGILMFLFLIIIGLSIILISDKNYILILTILLEGILNLSKIIFILNYSGSNEDYYKIKFKIFLFQILVDIIVCTMLGYYFFSQQIENICTVTIIMIYISLCFGRFLNFGYYISQ